MSRTKQIVLSVTPEMDREIACEVKRRSERAGHPLPKSAVLRQLLALGLRRDGSVPHVIAPRAPVKDHDCACRWYNGVRRHQCAACARASR